MASRRQSNIPAAQVLWKQHHPHGNLIQNNRIQSPLKAHLSSLAHLTQIKGKKCLKVVSLIVFCAQLLCTLLLHLKCTDIKKNFSQAGSFASRHVVYVYVIARAGEIFGIYFTSLGIAAVKSHEAKPSAISPLYQNEWNISQNFTTAHAITY